MSQADEVNSLKSLILEVADGKLVRFTPLPVTRDEAFVKIDLYLILHKVRGEPAFDIATRSEEGTASDPGPWWIIPTSGHRAYPYRYWRWSDLYSGSDIDCPKPEYVFNNVDPPEGLPDHYSVNAPRDPAPLTARVTGLLSTLGLGPRPIKRRPVT